ncbi:hypothetical protein R1flu_009546 [Riccia fluitans]|uniref:BHLH domain-containing protein n=1 Tax=Riccia fluitans TaxID=41844 RepID=A0ABD1Z4Y7_9MARC
MCPDVFRDPFSRVFFRTDAYQRCDSQQSFFYPAYDSTFKLRDDRSNAFLTAYERAHLQTNDCGGNFLNFQVEIDDTGWMSEVLEDLPIINQEIAELPVADISPPFSTLPPLNPAPTLQLEELLRPEVEDGHCQLQPSPTPFEVKHAAPFSRNAKPSAVSQTSQQSPARAAVSKPSKARGFKHSDVGKQKPRKMPKWAREASVDGPSEQVEHVLRERQRRDDMSCKIAVLEGLLPPCHKRDRASIVHDSVQYVKTLQQRVEDLRNKLVALNKRNSHNNTTITNTFTKTKISVSPEVVKATSMSQISDTSTGNSEAVAEKLFYSVEFYIQLEGCSEAAKLRRCKCRHDYLSSAMRRLEQLNIEISRCSVTKMCDHLICVIVVKPRSSRVHVPTPSSIAASLETAVAF